MKLLIATTNRKKLEELESLLKGLPFEFLSLKDIPTIPEVIEDGKTFRENAVKKAAETAKASGLLTLAEDSGLVVEALEGNPGVYSARFAGPEKDDIKNCLKVLRLMEKLPDNCRHASFISAVAVANPMELAGVVQGEVRGAISREMKGSNGFGYDPIFIYGPYGKTLGEVSAELKHRVSHRAEAVKKAEKILKSLINARPTRLL